MVSYKILDTGYATHAVSGTQLTVANRAGTNTAGSATLSFAINVENERLDGGGSVMDDKEIRTTDSLSSVSPVTFGNPIFVLNCSISRSNIPRTYQYSWLYQLMRLERTKSVKCLILQSDASLSVYQGVSTSLGDTTHLVDGNALWANDEWIGDSLKITSGANAGVSKTISDNTQTQLVTAAFSNPILAGTSYEIYAATANDYVADRLPLLTEMYGMKYLSGAFQSICVTETGRTTGTIPYLPGYVKSIGNFSISESSDKLSFSITFEVIE